MNIIKINDYSYSLSLLQLRMICIYDLHFYERIGTYSSRVFHVYNIIFNPPGSKDIKDLSRTPILDMIIKIEYGPIYVLLALPDERSFPKQKVRDL